MANELKLDKIVEIDGVQYEISAVSAETAGKVAKSLIFKTGNMQLGTFDGSAETNIEIPSINGLVTNTELDNKGYLIAPEGLKTINGTPIIGTGNIEISGGGDANTIKVNTDFGENGASLYTQATITISKADPDVSYGEPGAIWFKYDN